MQGRSPVKSFAGFRRRLRSSLTFQFYRLSFGTALRDSLILSLFVEYMIEFDIMLQPYYNYAKSYKTYHSGRKSCVSPNPSSWSTVLVIAGYNCLNKNNIISRSPKGVLIYPQRTHSACCPPRNDDLGGEVNIFLVLIKLILRRKILYFFSGPGEFFFRPG